MLRLINEIPIMRIFDVIFMREIFLLINDTQRKAGVLPFSQRLACVQLDLRYLPVLSCAIKWYDLLIKILSIQSWTLFKNIFFIVAHRIKH